MAKDLTVKTLHKVVDWIINGRVDCCEICAYLSASEWKGEGDIPDGVEPCFYRRTNGNKACRNGIIEYFQTQISKGKK